MGGIVAEHGDVPAASVFHPHRVGKRFEPPGRLVAQEHRGTECRGQRRRLGRIGLKEPRDIEAAQSQYPAAYIAQQVNQISTPGGGTSALVSNAQPGTVT